MKNKFLEEKVISVFDDEKTLDIFSENNINFIKDLWILKRKNLKDIGLNDTQINSIIIKLQLHGLDINKKIYSKM